MRHIASEIFTDEFFGSLAMEYRVLWIGLIASMADDQGRFLDNAALIRSIVFPYDEKITMKTIEQGLSLFVKHHKIIRYVAGTNGSGKRLIQITNWWKYQRSTQWAAKSQYPAPEKWYDRIRIHVPGNGNVPYLLNWNKEGGFVEPTKDVRSPFKGDKPKPKLKPKHKQKPIKNQPTPTPSLKNKKVVVGGQKKSPYQFSWYQELPKHEQPYAEIIAPILLSAGLRKPKIVTIISKVATRSKLTEAKSYVLAALASAFADEDAKSKPDVAAYRILNDSVPVQFNIPETWRILPATVLEVAGVNVEQLSKGKSSSRKINDIRETLGVSSNG